MINMLKKYFPVLSFWLGKKSLIFSTYKYRKNPVKWTKKTFNKRYNYKLNLDNPSLFCEKMNYLKHYFFNDKETILADKFKVKNLLIENGFEKYVIKVLFSTTNVKELKKWITENKNRVKKFVIKENHSCGDIYIYDNGVITRKYGKQLKRLSQMYRMLKIGLGYNHYYTCFEKPYKNIPPLIFVEEYIEMSDAVEYELMCNYGNVKFINLVSNRQNSQKKEVYVDPNFKSFLDNEKFVKPSCYNELTNFALYFCKKFPFCRVDFIVCKNTIKFCEFTFIKSGGMRMLEPIELESILGKMIEL